jgi:acetyl-CoA carboxylase / biotin carboxylase 1
MATLKSNDRYLTRTGLVCAVENIDALEARMVDVARIVLEQSSAVEVKPRNIVNIAIKSSPCLDDDEKAYEVFHNIVTNARPLLKRASINRITLMIIEYDQFPRYFTFKASKGYDEDAIIRNTEPAVRST